MIGTGKMKHKDKIVFDTETTGLPEPEATLVSQQPHMIEIYAARLYHKNKVIDEVDALIYSPIEIPKFITKITGIDGDMLLGAPEFIELYKPLVNLFIGTRTVIGHNISFDMGILWIELRRIGKEFKFPWQPEWYCTMERSMHLENKRLKLGKLHEYATGEEFKEGAHRARQDVLATLRCYKWMIKEGM